MAKFFINRPIVAMVISIMFIVIGIVALVGLPISQFPEIVPPEVQIWSTYTGADAKTVEQSVATPIEQQLSGVDNMNYMFSINANNGSMRLTTSFDVATSPNTDLMLTQIRQNLAEPQLPQDVRNYGVTVQKARSAPLMILSVYSPNESLDAKFLANYAYINLVDQLLRVPGVGMATVWGSGMYAIRIWVKPDMLAKLAITVPQVIDAVQKQNTVNPAGQIGAEPAPPGQEFTYSVSAQGRLVKPEEFGQIVLRANSDGSVVRLNDVARIELGSQVYTFRGRLNGKPAANLGIYQLPGTNAIETANGVRRVMEQAKRQFPAGLDYIVGLDTTRAITEGIHEIIKTLLIAMTLVIIVVFVFLQGWRPTLIPAIAVPVSLIGTFAFFPFLGFSVNTLSLFGLVLAIGLVVDDAIVVVECVERHIEEGMKPKDAAFRAMQEVSGPVVAIALVLSAVFIPTVFIPGITGRLYRQFAATIAISVLISAFNALSLSPALAALLLKPRKEARGPLGFFYRLFNRWFGRATTGYVGFCQVLIRKGALCLLFLAGITVLSAGIGKVIPTGFLPEEDQGYMFVNVSLPNASSMQRTDEACKEIEKILAETPGVQYYQTIIGISLLSLVQNTYSAFFFVNLKEWKERNTPEQRYEAIMDQLNRELAKLSQCTAFAFSPPAIPGIGTAGGVTMILEDRAGRDIDFLSENVNKFLDAARKRPELASVRTTFLPTVPQVFINVDRDKVLKQGINIDEVYQTLQAFMGGYFINYFNRFGRQWQVYVQADGAYRTKAEDVGLFYVRNDQGDPVPLSAVSTIESRMGPEFTMRYNMYRSAQINAMANPGYSSAQAMSALEQAFYQSMPQEMGFDYLGMSFQEKKAQEGIPAIVIFGFSLFCVFLILAALYESWSLPVSVLLGTPIAVFGALTAIWLRGQVNNVYAQIGLIVLIGLAAKNAILIVEFAKNSHDQGKSPEGAALEGARLRLRPILMTSFAFLFGTLPLAISTGSGAFARQIMGTAVMGGTTAASLIAIFLIPVTFYVVVIMTEKRRNNKKSENVEGNHA